MAIEAKVTMARSPCARPVPVGVAPGTSMGNQLIARRQAANTDTSATTSWYRDGSVASATAIPAPATPIAIVMTRYHARYGEMP